MSALLHCDGLGCDETHPERHDEEGQQGFIGGRWQGWLYLDINRADLINRPLRFCRIDCLDWWIHESTMMNQRVQHDPVVDEVAVKRVKR